MMQNKPWDSAAVLSGANTATPTFVADVPGVYELMLEVSDSKGIRSNPEQVWVGVDDCTPLAVASGPGGIIRGEIVQLDGSASFSPCGRLITYSWNFVALPAGSSATFNNPGIINPSFTADIEGEYRINLIVTDSKGLTSYPAEVIVTAYP